MYRFIERVADQDRTALVFIDYAGHRRDYRYAETADQTRRYAAALAALGVGRSSRVALCNANTARCLFLLLALDRLGAAAVLCAEDIQGEPLVEKLTQPPVTALISNRRGRDRLQWIHERLPAETLYALVGEDCEGWARLDTLAAAVKTPPDPVQVPAAREDIEQICTGVLQAQPGDRIWCTLPFAAPDWEQFAFAPWCAGATAILDERPFEVHQREELLYEVDATIVCQPAAEYEALLAAGSGSRMRRLPRIRRWVALHAADDLCRRWEAACGKPLHAG